MVALRRLGATEGTLTATEEGLLLLHRTTTCAGEDLQTLSSSKGLHRRHRCTICVMSLPAVAGECLSRLLLLLPLSLFPLTRALPPVP